MGTDDLNTEIECEKDGANNTLNHKEPRIGKKGKKLTKSQVKRLAQMEKNVEKEVSENSGRMDTGLKELVHDEQVKSDEATDED